ncbi:MAG: hypothetical protein R3C05_28280 [Pirellulaceae bacterium]
MFQVKDRADCLTMAAGHQHSGRRDVDAVAGRFALRAILAGISGRQWATSFSAGRRLVADTRNSTNPIVDVDSSDPNAITEPMTAKWARLADQRYALLLALLQQFFTTEESQKRLGIQQWCFSGAMYPLAILSEKLTGLNRRPGVMLKAALPFTLPEVINLPPDAESRLALILRRLQRTQKLSMNC